MGFVFLSFVATALGTKVPSDGGPHALNPVLADFSSE